MLYRLKNKLKRVYQQATAPFVFVKEFIHSPSSVGSVYPSSRRLASSIVKDVMLLNDNDVIIELGPGTGIITTALLKKGISPKQIIAIEKSPKLVQFLKKAFSGVTVIEGDAAHLDQILSNFKDKKIRYIVSSLPFRSIPDEQVQLITPQIAKIVDEGAQFIQFSYSLYKKQPDYFSAMQLSKTSMVWLNIPPARVSVFNNQKERSGDS